MRKSISLLAVLLAVQGLLAIGLGLSGPDLSTQRADTPLIELGDGPIDRLTIEGPDGERVVLARRDGSWVLPERGDFSADGDKVGQLIEQLRGLKRGPAVATSRAALRRFKVGDQDYERRIELQRGGETVATLYLGSSPGLRRVHARSAADDAVYATAFEVYQAPLKSGDWARQDLLQFPVDTLTKVKVAGLTLTRTPVDADQQSDQAGDETGDELGDELGDGQANDDQTGADLAKADPAADKAGGWTAAPLQQGETLDQASAGKLAQAIASLTYSDLLTADQLPDQPLETAVLTLGIERDGGEPVEYRLGKHGEYDYLLKVSNRPAYFVLPGYLADPLIEAAARDTLVTAPPAETAETAAEAAPTAPATADPSQTAEPPGTEPPASDPPPPAGGQDAN